MQKKANELWIRNSRLLPTTARDKLVLNGLGVKGLHRKCYYSGDIRRKRHIRINWSVIERTVLPSRVCIVPKAEGEKERDPLLVDTNTHNFGEGSLIDGCSACFSSSYYQREEKSRDTNSHTHALTECEIEEDSRVPRPIGFTFSGHKKSVNFRPFRVQGNKSRSL